MKKQNFKNLISIVLALMMISSIWVMIIPVGAADSDYPKELPTNENVVVNGVTYRFDRLSQNSDSKAVVNPDNTITLTMKQGDLFWMPSITIGDDSNLNMKVTRVSGTANQASGLAYNIDAGTNGIWAEDTDSLNVMNIQTNYRTRIGKGTVSSMKQGNLDNEFVKKAYFTDNGGTDGNVPEAAKEVYNSAGQWKENATLEMNLSLDSSENKVVASFRNGSGVEFANRNYTVGEEPKVFEGPVGFAVNWTDGTGYIKMTINSFEIKNAIVNGQKTDFSLSSSLTYEDTTGVVVPTR